MKPSRIQPITLGALIEQLEARPHNDLVGFDFGYTVPTGIRSFRGYYDHLAFGYEDMTENGEYAPRVCDVLKYLRPAHGQFFSGFKGGRYLMDRSTPLWVANYGQANGTAVLGVLEDTYRSTIIATGFCELFDLKLRRFCGPFEHFPIDDGVDR